MKKHLTVTGHTTLHDGSDYYLKESFTGNNERQVLSFITRHREKFYPLVGEKIFIDFGRGRLVCRILEEAWGKYRLERC